MTSEIAKRRLKLAQAYGLQGKLEEAMRELTRIIEEDPEYGDAYYFMAIIDEKRGLLDESARRYQLAIRYGLSSRMLQGFAHCNLGAIYVKRDRLDEAKTELELALKCNPDDAIALYNLGTIELVRRNLDAAVENFELARMLNPNLFERNELPRQRLEYAKKLLLRTRGMPDEMANRLQSKERAQVVDQLATLFSAPYDAFISYKSEDVDLARHVADQLIASGIKVWFAEYQILIKNYDDFQQAIDCGIRNSSYGLAFTNDRYSKSPYCCREMEQLLAIQGANKVMEIKIQEEDGTHRKFVDLDHSPQLVFNGQIGPILSFISSKTGWPVHVLKSVDEPAFPHDFQGICMGQPYHIDIDGWNLVEKGGMCPTFELAHSPNTTFVNIVAGPEFSRAAIRHDSDDRRMYEELMNYAPRHLEELGAKLCGLHLFFYKGLSQMALTYWHRGYWTRKYSIILQHPQDQKPAEFVFTFGLIGSFQEYCRQVYKMDHLVKSLKWM